MRKGALKSIAISVIGVSCVLFGNPWCNGPLSDLGRIRYGTDQTLGSEGNGNSSEARRFSELPVRLRFLLGIMGEHPNIVSANTDFHRNLLERLSHVAELSRLLGRNFVSMESEAPQRTSATYVPAGEVRHSERAIRAFLDDRVNDLNGLNLLPGRGLLEQLQHIERTSVKADGSFDQQIFKRRTNQLYRLLPFLFDASGGARFQDLGNSSHLQQTVERIRNTGVGELENLYTDLVPQHLAGLVRDLTRDHNLSHAWNVFQSYRTGFLRREVPQALTAREVEGRQQAERHLMLERLPGVVGLFRGCYGGDCSIVTVPYYSTLRNTRVYFIRRGEDPNSEPVGYVFSALVKVNGRDVPYILTINGNTLDRNDVRMAVRMVARDYGKQEVVLPDFVMRNGLNNNLVNGSEARTGMTFPNGRRVQVGLPTGWEVIDQYLVDHPSEYTNYYQGSRVNEGILVTVPEENGGLIGEIRQTHGATPRYLPIHNIHSIPELERAILANQILADSDGVDSREDLISNLGLTQARVTAAAPLVAMSETRPLRLAEYRALATHFGFNLDKLLNFKLETRAETLRALYEESPQLFTEHRLLGNGRYIQTLREAYAPGRSEELVRRILSARDLSDSNALTVLQKLKKAFRQDLGVIGEVLALVQGASVEREVRGALRNGFLDSAIAATRTGQRIIEGLSSRNVLIREFYQEILGSRNHPNFRQQPIIPALGEIAKRMTDHGETFEQAAANWLSQQNDPVRVAHFLRLHVGTEQFQEHLNRVPEDLRARVQAEINRFSNISLYQSLADRMSSTGQRPGFWRNLFGRHGQSTRRSEPVVPWPGNIESFEFQGFRFPAGGTKVTLGSPPNEPGRYNNENQREVTLTQNFEMARAPMTQLQVFLAMGPEWFREHTPNFIGDSAITINGVRLDPNRPMENISWHDARAIAEKLSELDPHYNYRLPTEAEWEFAARGGTTTAYSFGNSPRELGDFARFSGNAGSQTHPVGELLPNPMGLYDMHGNVWEWVHDAYNPSPSGGTDPVVDPSSGPSRVVRGGSFRRAAQALRSASRDYGDPDHRGSGIGARLVRTPK